MIKTAFTCNSLRPKHFFRFIWVRMRTFQPKKLINACIEETAGYFKIKPDAVFLFGSARMGLYTLLSADPENKKEEVIVAGYTCVVVTNAIKYAGLKAIYIDVEEENLNIDPLMLKAAINEHTRAIVFTHNFGISCEYIEEFKAEFPDIMIIEDAAHTFGSVTKEGKLAGTIGDASFFSLEYSKPLTAGMGGILIVNDPVLRKKVQRQYEDMPFYPFITRIRIFASLSVHLFTSSRHTAFLKRWGVGFLYLSGLLFRSPAAEIAGERPKRYPVKLSAGLAYIVYLQLRDIKNIQEKKKKLVEKYHSTFKDLEGVRQYYSTEYDYVRYPILFNKEISMDKIATIKQELKKSGIVAGEWFNDVVHPKGSFRYCYIDGSCPIGESVADRMINLPVTVHKQLNDKDLNRIKEVFKKHLIQHSS